MPPLTPSQTREEQDYHVHLTGFGPFHNVPVNPSWEAVQKLHDTILSSPPSSHPHDSESTSHKRIRLTSSLIPVKYSSVLSLIPALHTTGVEGSKPDLIIHVGVGLDGSIRLEQRARKWDYEKLDVEGQLGPFDKDENKRGFAGAEWMEMREELRTEVDGKTVVEKVKRRGVEHVDISENAGLYLCEFTYFASLASALKQNSGRPAPVQFIHVPPVGKPYSLEELTTALRILVWAIVNEGGLL